MNVSRRRYMGAKGGSSPYQRIAYLESSGTQYIDTGEFFNGLTTKIYLKYSAILNKYFVIGAGSTDNKNSFIFANGGSTGRYWNFYFFRYKNNYTQSSIGSQTDEVREAELTSDFVVDGTTVKAWTASDFTTPVSVFLFSTQKADGTVGTCGTFRIYACKIYQNDVLVKDFVPVRIGQVGYLYDKISGELFGNDGSGNFTLGPDIN